MTEKHWHVGGLNIQFKSLEEAEKAGKRRVGTIGPYCRTAIDEVIIYEAVSVITTPVPDYEVVKL